MRCVYVCASLLDPITLMKVVTTTPVLDRVSFQGAVIYVPSGVCKRVSCLRTKWAMTPDSRKQH